MSNGMKAKKESKEQCKESVSDTSLSCSNENEEIQLLDIPGIVRNSPIYGNYIVASRNIDAGEIICEAKPLTIAPYGPSDRLPFCLSCCKDLALSERCTKCKWPICNNDGKCQNDPTHNAECEIFSKKNIRFRGTRNEYGALDVLRALLLRNSDPTKWNQLLTFESHNEARNQSKPAVHVRNFIISFIREECELIDFDVEVIDKVFGILSVNTFWAFRDTQRYASLLFDKRVTLFSHDCDPNTFRTIMQTIEFDENNKPCPNANFFIRIWASRAIQKDEQITITYTDIKDDVKTRQEHLKETFYFDCQCNRCLKELLEENLIIKNEDGKALSL